MKKYISFDVGGTNIKYGIVSENGEILRKDKFKTNSNGDTVLADICKVIEKAKENDDIIGAAFSMPGFIDVNAGMLITAGALFDLYGLNLKEHIEEKTGVKAEVENDVNCVALAEKWLGNAVNNKNFLCMTIGTGIGGAIVINDQLYRGKGFFAGEFGYMLTSNFFENENVESNLSFTGSVYAGIRKKYSDTIGIDIDSINGEDVFIFADKGDQVAEKIVDDFYKNLAIGLFNLIFLFNPEKILIGGAISSRDDLIQKIKINIENIIKSNNTLTQIDLDKIVDIDKCHFSNDSALIGALYHFLRKN